MAGTFSQFILSRMDSSYAMKRRVLLHEMKGTLQGALRGAHNVYSSITADDRDLAQEGREAKRFIRSLNKRVTEIYSGKKL
jgi:hypothetical protein